MFMVAFIAIVTKFNKSLQSSNPFVVQSMFYSLLSLVSIHFLTFSYFIYKKTSRSKELRDSIFQSFQKAMDRNDVKKAVKDAENGDTKSLKKEKSPNKNNLSRKQCS
jgi:hypothetical protein